MMTLTSLAAILLCSTLVFLTLGMLIVGGLSGERSHMVALLVVALSFVPFAIDYQHCQHSDRLIEIPLIECLDPAAPLYPILGLMYGAMTLLAVYSRADDNRIREALAGAWHELGAGVDGDWRQKGPRLHGNHLGHRVEAASVYAPAAGPYSGGTTEYTVSTFVAPGGRPWTLRRSRGWRPWSEPRWRIYAFPPALARRLEIAGATEVVGRAEPYLSTLPPPRITYRPSDGRLRLRINFLFVPRAAAFQQHLTLLSELTGIDAAENTGGGRAAASKSR